MKTQYIISTLVIVFLTISVFGQNGKEIKGVKYYEAYSYQKAIEKFEGISEKSTEINRKLADSYLKTGDLKKSEEYYAAVVSATDNTPEDFYNYSSVLMMNKKYADSEVWMKKYHKKNANDSRAKEYANQKGYYKSLEKDNGQFRISNLDINSAQSDFGTAYYLNKMVFASSREGTVPVKRRWNWNGLAFLNLYLAEKSGTNELSELDEFYPRINKKYHEGPATFNKSCNFMVLTRNNYKEKDPEGVVRLELFSLELVDGKWTNEQPLPFNHANHSVGHASLTADGKTMYFASDMPGGRGGVDLYKATLNDDGSWSKPENLGEKINTEGNEMFPFIHETEKMLFYSSDGKVGLGGLDIFVVQLTNSEIGKVENIGAPVNTSMDDFAFVLDANEKGGFFSSNREGGKGDDDIYSYKLIKPFVFGKTIKGVAKDKDGKILANTKVTLFDENGEEIESETTEEDGSYIFLVDADKTYKLTGAKDDYFDGENTANTKTEKSVIIADLELEKDPGLSLYGLITDKETGDVLDQVKVTLVDNFTNEEILNIETPETGDFRQPLTGKKLNDRLSYQVHLEKEGYLGKTYTFNKEITQPGEILLHSELDFKLEKIEVGADLAKIIDIKPIYFDLNKSNIRPDAAIELDKIVKVMTENPNMVIELGSHTDSRGSDASNRSLSDRRAKSSAKYIVEQGIDKSRISGKGFGESAPNVADKATNEMFPYILEGQVLTEEFINGLKSDTKKFKEAHQLNRRTEFIIVKM